MRTVRMPRRPDDACVYCGSGILPGEAASSIYAGVGSEPLANVLGVACARCLDTKRRIDRILEVDLELEQIEKRLERGEPTA